MTSLTLLVADNDSYHRHKRGQKEAQQKCQLSIQIAMVFDVILYYITNVSTNIAFQNIQTHLFFANLALLNPLLQILLSCSPFEPLE